MFIFLICFFFISFLSTIRWCQTRIRPRRETRGVSRSKCGDLITACIPVSWAMSIIVNESTDATDLNDGFGTAELVVGVRAYQWGWEYYYPKSIDLNYNVRPSYSTFIGNSIQYNFASNKMIGSNTLWRMYQNKTEDRVITPAYLLLMPINTGAATNFINFKHVGLNLLKEASAFSKIRNATKVYNSHLVSTPSSFINKYNLINTFFINENNTLTTSNFSLKKQHTLASTSSLIRNGSLTVLDNFSFVKLVQRNWGSNVSLQTNYSTFNQSQFAPLGLKTVNSAAQNLRIFNLLVPANLKENSSLNKLLYYPTALETINASTDKSGVLYPSLKITSANFIKGNFNNAPHVNEIANYDQILSVTQPYTKFSWSNTSSNAQIFSLAGANNKVLLADQSIRAHPNLLPSKTNYNLAPTTNSITSNNFVTGALNLHTNPFSQTLSFKTNYPDYFSLNSIISSRSFMSGSYPAILSASTNNWNSLNYDESASMQYEQTQVNGGQIEEHIIRKNNSVGEVFIGSREKTPRSINTAYWSSLWSLSNPSNRITKVLQNSFGQSLFYLPVFTAYTDYDFRNDQALDMLEELFWENNYSAYNFYDYMNLSKNFSKDFETTKEEMIYDRQFLESNLNLKLSNQILVSKIKNDKCLVGESYGTSVQMEDFIKNPQTMLLKDFALLPIYQDVADLDESFNSFMSIKALFSKFSTTSLGISNGSLTPKSYISVFNNFRSDYDDFSWQREQLTNSNILNNDLNVSDAIWFDGSLYGNDSRSTNAAVLRPSIRNSVVNYNAFQKVFRPRLDEGRANVQSRTFSDMYVRQPFLSDMKIPYNQLLGKNRTSFFETPLYVSSTHKVLNVGSTLLDSLNTQMYDFPFLLAKTSDIIRFTWIDWFSKWKYVEVQPSSISKYSILGVPYLRKPFDFNSNTGDTFQDTELYFTRVARSRRNYLPNWSYSPFMYNRTYVWNSMSKLDPTFINEFNSLSSAKSIFNWLTWYWQSPLVTQNMLNNVNYSLSGNSIYGKSTWQPTNSMALYFYNMSKLVDILSKREFFYRQYFEQSQQIINLPNSLCATPTNPLFRELKSSFLFNDPANFSSEFSRDLLFTSAPYFKFLLFKNVLQTVNDVLNTLPINTNLLTNYVLFYFYTPSINELTPNSEIFKSQFRPLRKGISSMLRLHATGAVAMPIGIRLQVLASSRDVIHSWAIPAASIKIDCVPGYTSHRMMKFLLIGVYWGQCQEICGRYHHWMPIVVKFETPDNFAIWVTHFVSAPTPNEVWDISDRRFANLIRSASYDKSAWLNNLN